METIGSGGSPGNMEKIIKWVVTLGLAGLAVFVFNKVAPSLEELVDNAWELLIYGVPLAFVLFLIFATRKTWWMWIRGFAKKLGDKLIEVDPLSTMYGYIEQFKEKLAKLKKSIEAIDGMGEKIQRVMDETTSAYNGLMKKAAAAKQMGDDLNAASFSRMAAVKKDSMSHYLPLQKRIKDALAFMEKLADNWGRSIMELTDEVQTRKTEYDTMKEIVGGLKGAEGFIDANSEEATQFKTALDALQTNVSAKIGYLNQFEKNSNGFMISMDLTKKVEENEGLAALDDWMKDKNLLMPEEKGGWLKDGAAGNASSLSGNSESTSAFDDVLKIRK